MTALLQTLGGVGLFLFGMAVMTSGLRKIAGDRLRGWLAKSTGNPVTGALTGATVTALIQSSSATTVAAIGFVGAGLMTFSASLGIIFGANIGTTFTGWMVALLGFKLQLDEAALPLLFIAALCYLLKRIRPVRGFGKALAGFCLLFLGIAYLQDGLAGYRDTIDLSHWSASDYGGRILLVLVGVLLTLITQSSSATVATALAALSTAILDLPQAAAVIIGADIGTTGTAALATIGGTTASRRTGFAHVIYNLMTGIAAFFLLPLYLLLLGNFWPEGVADSPEVVAVGFHSAFNILGVIAVLPFTRPFAAMIQRIFPDRSSPLIASFDDRVLEDPHAALGSLETGCRSLSETVFTNAILELDSGGRKLPHSNEEVLLATKRARDFAIAVGGSGDEDSKVDPRRIFDCIHLIDHVERLARRLGDPSRIRAIASDESLRETAAAFTAELSQWLEILQSEGEPNPTRQRLEERARELEEGNSDYRRMRIAEAREKQLPGRELDQSLDARRWLRRVVYHAARIARHTRFGGE